MRIMITGVAGFIGSNLAQHLLTQGHEIVGIDNMSQGEPLNMASFKEHENFHFHEADIMNLDDMISLSEGCDMIVHMAAYKIPRYSDALDTLHINGFGTDNVAKAATKHGIKIVAASTSDVYGKNPQIPFSETSNLVVGNPDVRRWAYAISKMYEEQLLFAYRERYEIPVVLLRFFGGYGPNQNLTWWGGPQSVFINKALDDEVIPIHGDGMQTRSFTYIADHVEGITRCMMMDEANNQVFNIGNDYEITIRDLAFLIWRLVRGEDSEPKVEFIPYETFGKYEDVRRRVPDKTHAKAILGFEASMPLEDGLKQTIQWQIERRRLLGIDTMDVTF
ncbi:MAG: GDP-mannose 4,6-dehydratase [Chloroflexota bacterium]